MQNTSAGRLPATRPRTSQTPLRRASRAPRQQTAEGTVSRDPSTPEALIGTPADPSPQPILDEPVPEETLAVPEEGLEPRPQSAKRVVIVGGGIAGLVAAFELARQGHEPLLLEAQDRVGGRVYTLRDWAPGLYIEAGAMRIPRVHDLTLEYCNLFGLRLRPFVMGNAKAFVYVGGERMTMAEADEHPERLPFELEEHERGRTYSEMWNEATQEVRDLYEKEGHDAFEQILREYDQYSIREFLQMRGFSEGAIELYGVMSFREQNMNAAVIEQLREIVGRSFEDMQEIVGGTDMLPRAFYEQVKHYVRFGAEVHAIEQSEHDVTVHYRTAGNRFSVTGDYAICTLPYPVMRSIEVTPSLSRGKQKAIRELHYNSSAKIVFQTRTRFWEKEPLGIVGGTSATDLSIRRIVYPSFSDPEEERGMLLASYTWGSDAVRWASMGKEDAVEQALEDVAKIHPEIVNEFELGTMHSWDAD